VKVEVPFPSERRRRNEHGGALPMCALKLTSFVLTWFRVLRVGGLAVARRLRSLRSGRLRWKRAVLCFVTGATVITSIRVYRARLLGPVPEFPAQMEQSINAYLKGDSLPGDDMVRLGISAVAPIDPWPGRSSRPNGGWLQSSFLSWSADIPENAMSVPPGGDFKWPITAVGVQFKVRQN